MILFMTQFRVSTIKYQTDGSQNPGAGFTLMEILVGDHHIGLGGNDHPRIV